LLQTIPEKHDDILKLEIEADKKVVSSLLSVFKQENEQIKADPENIYMLLQCISRLLHVRSFYENMAKLSIKPIIDSLDLQDRNVNFCALDCLQLLLTCIAGTVEERERTQKKVLCSSVYECVHVCACGCLICSRGRHTDLMVDSGQGRDSDQGALCRVQVCVVQL
jgi:hypothetical protein